MKYDIIAANHSAEMSKGLDVQYFITLLPDSYLYAFTQIIFPWLDYLSKITSKHTPMESNGLLYWAISELNYKRPDRKDKYENIGLVYVGGLSSFLSFFKTQMRTSALATHVLVYRPVKTDSVNTSVLAPIRLLGMMGLIVT